MVTLNLCIPSDDDDNNNSHMYSKFRGLCFGGPGVSDAPFGSGRPCESCGHCGSGGTCGSRFQILTILNPPSLLGLVDILR